MKGREKRKKSIRGRTMRLPGNPETGLRHTDIHERGIFRRVENVYEDDTRTADISLLQNDTPLGRYLRLALNAEAILESSGEKTYLATLTAAQRETNDPDEIERRVDEWARLVADKYREDGGPVSRQALAAEFLRRGGYISENFTEAQMEAVCRMSEAWHSFCLDTQGAHEQIVRGQGVARGAARATSVKEQQKEARLTIVAEALAAQFPGKPFSEINANRVATTQKLLNFINGRLKTNHEIAARTLRSDIAELQKRLKS